MKIKIIEHAEKALTYAQAMETPGVYERLDAKNFLFKYLIVDGTDTPGIITQNGEMKILSLSDYSGKTSVSTYRRLKNFSVDIIL